jgi:hypothetical protein
MRKFFLLLLVAAASCLSLQALTVENTAGNLKQLVTDTQITQLTVTGTMDARDFLFITDELKALTAVDLSQVTIVPFNTGKALYGTVTNYNGNEIPRTAFFGKKLTSVALPAGLKSIGFAAFAGCRHLSSVSLPASVTYLDDYAFAGTALTSVELPATLNGMGKGVFSRCEALQSATINAKFIGDFAFLGDVQLSNVTVGANVEYILRGVFNGCTALKSINFDPSCRLSRIDEEAFINSGLENIDINALGVGTIGDWAFAQTRLSAFALPNGMTQLGEGSLAHNPLLASVIFPGPDHSNGTGGRSNGLYGANRAPSRYRTLSEVKDYTFAGDDQLNPGMMFKEGVNTIGAYALYNVSTEIDTMRLPSSVNYLGDYAMAGMTGMKVLKTDAEAVPSLGMNVWAGVDQQSIPLITASSEVAEDYKVADQWMNFFFKTEVEVLMGDVNDDGYVDVNDVTTLINYVLNGQGDVNLAAADISGDGEVDVNDVTEIINYVLMGAASKSPRAGRAVAARQFVSTSDALSFQQSTLRAGQTADIEVALTNSEHNYTAVQFDLVLPQGVELVSINGVDRGSGHNYYSVRNTVDDNAYAVMGVSMSLQDYPGEEGNVLSLTLSASDDFNAQDAQLVLTNVILATGDFQSFTAGDAVADVNNTTGIENVTAHKEVAAVRYINVAGQESETPFSGVNIVVTTYTDGTTSTVKVVK